MNQRRSPRARGQRVRWRWLRGRWQFAAAAFAAVALVAVGVATASRGGDGLGRSGSEVVGGAAPLAFVEPLVRYAVDYRVEYADGTPSGTYRIVARRPWRTIVVTTSDDGTETQVADFGALTNDPAGAAAVGFVVPPTLGAGDVRPEIALPAAVAAGTAERAERRRVLGTECQVYRTGEPLDAGPVTAPGTDRVETCVDGRGLVLEEVLVVDGRPVQRRIATAVDPDPAAAADDGRTEPAATGVDQGGAGLRALGAGERFELATWDLETPPGFRLQGRYAVVHPRLDAGSEPRAAAGRLTSVVSVWVRGPDVVVFEVGATTDGSAAPSVAGSSPVAWPPGREAGASPGPSQLVLSARGNELRHTEAATLVRLMATVAPDELLALAAGIGPSLGES